MFCKNCGKELNKADKFCANCGAKVAADENCECKQHCKCACLGQTYSLLGFLTSFFNPIIGLVLSIIALCRIAKQENKKGKGLAIAGLVISAIIIVALIIALFICIGDNLSQPIYVYNY